MKVIDIYNKIANGEELPKKIKYAGDIYEYEEKQLDYRTTYSSRNMYLLAHHNNFVLNETIEIIEEPILTDKEREYLKAVIKPFNVTSIGKHDWNDETEYIKIEVNEEWIIEFPTFKKGTRYKGMKLDRYYTVEELDLEED